MPKSNKFFILFAGFGGVIYQSFSANNSKGLLLTPILVLIGTLKFRNEIQNKVAKFFTFFLSASLFIPLFTFLQSRKLGVQTIEIANQHSENLPFYFSPFLIVTQRFDQFSRVTDVFSAQAHSMGGYLAWFQYALKSLEWNPVSGRNELSFGQNWNQLVTSQSITGSNLSQVSLAQGMIAEGLIWKGLASMIVECALMALLAAMVIALLERSDIALVFSFGVIANMALFEAGLISTLGFISSASKVSLFLWIIKKFLSKKESATF
jgi:hypothetical protein